MPHSLLDKLATLKKSDRPPRNYSTTVVPPGVSGCSFCGPLSDRRVLSARSKSVFLFLFGAVLDSAAYVLAYTHYCLLFACPTVVPDAKATVVSIVVLSSVENTINSVRHQKAPSKRAQGRGSDLFVFDRRPAVALPLSGFRTLVDWPLSETQHELVTAESTD